MRMRRIVICGLPGSTVFFHIISQTARISKKKLLNPKCMFIFPLQPFFSENFSFQDELSEIWSKMYIGLHVKYPLFLSDFNGNWIFSTYFRNILKISNFMKIRPVGVELLFHAVVRMGGRDEANIRFFASLRTRLKIIGVCSEVHKNLRNAMCVCGGDGTFWNVKCRGMWRNHWVLNG